MNRSPHRISSPRSHQAFTLVEVLVALAIFSVLLVIILVPIRLAFDSLSAGRAKANVQQAAQTTMNQLTSDLQHAIYVFPNAQLSGVTDQAPYPASGLPYFISNDNSTDPNKYNIEGLCSGVAEGNVARIDMLVPRSDNAGRLTVPIQSEDYIVTYYARRLHAKDYNDKFDIISNPIVLFRAQMPFRNRDTTSGNPGTSLKATDMETQFPSSPPTNAFNLDTATGRYDSTNCGSNSAELDRNTYWLSHNYLGEANLEPLCVDPTGHAVPGAHTLAMPSDLTLTMPNVNSDGTVDLNPGALVPTSTFRCEDSNSDGKIDRVTINLSMTNYNGDITFRNGKPIGQTIRLTRTVDLPNVR